MSEIHWTLYVLLAFAFVFTLMRAWNKDTRGALTLVLALIIAAFAVISVSGCTVTREYRPYMEVGMAYDFPKTVGSNPACIVRVRQPVLPERVTVSYTHHSSCRDLYDRNTVDQIEVTATIPLGRAR